MTRRDFIIDSTVAFALGSSKLRGKGARSVALCANEPRLDESLDGKPTNLARFGEFLSWTNPEATPAIQKAFARGHANKAPLCLAALSEKSSRFDVGVEWPEFRTINKIVIQFAAKEAPPTGSFFLEAWRGLTGLQGRWEEIENMYGRYPLQGLAMRVDSLSWAFPFSTRKSCKVRIRLQDNKHVGIDNFEVYGPSSWKVGNLRIEWGYLSGKNLYDGQIEIYNGEIVQACPIGTTHMRGPFTWASSTDGKNLGGLSVKLLYTRGENVDRTVLTLRTKSGDFSFLPAEALEGEPIDIPHFGVFVRSDKASLDRAAYRRNNAKKSRIIDLVRKLPEQTLAQAYDHVHVKRVPLCFVGVDSNNQKFGVAPDGHFVIGNNDPSCGRPIVPNFAVYFDSSESSTLFEDPPFKPDELFKEVEEKHQKLEEGWLPIITNTWSRNDLHFERTDFASLCAASEPVDQSKLEGNELAVLISQLKIRNNSPVRKTASYFIKPWKPQAGSLGYGALPSNIPSAWEVLLDEGFITVAEGDRKYSLMYVDNQGTGKVNQEPQLGAIRYSAEISPGDEQSIWIVVSGYFLPKAERSKLQNLQYGRLHEATSEYWKNLHAKGMQVEIPNTHLQNIYNASLHHFLLAMTKDGKRGEFYANTATFDYGAIGSESTPVVQALDMRGLQDRSEKCLRAWLSTQGDSMPDGDYKSKTGGFYHFWPIYTIDQGGVLWALAEHYLYTKDTSWLRKVAPQIIAGCDFIIHARKGTMKTLPSGRKPPGYGLAPAGTIFDMRDWESTFMLNGWFYFGLKKSAEILIDVDTENAKRIAAEAETYRKTILSAFKENVALSPVTRLLDNTSVPSASPFPGIRGFRTELQDIPDVGYGRGYIYDVEGGPLHLVTTGVVDPNGIEAAWMLNYLEDRFFTYSPGPCRVQLDDLSTDWFDLGGFPKLQPYYLHYQRTYLQRDEIPNFLRGFFDTLASTADPQTLTFEESLSEMGGQPNKTHEEGWFFHQLRFMLVMEIGNDLFLGRGLPRRWFEDGKRIAVSRAPTYFGKVGYEVRSAVARGYIEARVNAPSRNLPAKMYLRFRHPQETTLKRVTVNGEDWKDFDPLKEWIKLPARAREQEVVGYY